MFDEEGVDIYEEKSFKSLSCRQQNTRQLSADLPIEPIGIRVNQRKKNRLYAHRREERVSLFLLCISFEQSDLNRDGYLSLTDGLINIYICKHTQCRYGIYIYFQLDSKSDMCSCSVLLFSFFLYFFLLTSRCIEKVDTNGDQI